MRVLAGIGFVLFAYLTLIPAGLVAATVDPSCTGECESTARAILLTAVYGACALALVATAAAFAAYAVRPSPRRAAIVARALAVSATVIGIALFVLLALAFPLAGLALGALGTALFLWLRHLQPHPPPDPRSNGHGPSREPR